MSSDNLTLVLHKTDDLRLEQTPLPQKPGFNEVILQTSCVGICGSDVHYWKHGRIGDFIVKGPLILGHETCATVAEVGEGVSHIKAGDRVAVEPTVPCRCCSYCKEGSYNLCPDIKCHATPPVNGSLRRYFKYAADFCYKLPENVSDEEGSLMEPLSVAIHACRRARVTIGSSVLVCGAGPIGLVNILVAKAMGATQICVTDINTERLKVAKELGADQTIAIESGLSVEQLVSKVREQMGKCPDISIECSGAQSSIKLAILSTKSGGTVVLVGLGPTEVTIPIADAAIREVDIRGVFRYKNSYPSALALISTGKINVKPLVTHRFKLEEAVKAFEAASKGLGIKIMIHCKEG